METGILIDEAFRRRLRKGWLKSVTEQILTLEKVPTDTELGLVITDQEGIRKLNRRYRDRDEPTDVLAFSTREEAEGDTSPFIQPPDGVTHLGEVIISYPQAAAQAEDQGHAVEKELAILLTHGILHLLGFDHDIPERGKPMKAREAAIMKEIWREKA